MCNLCRISICKYCLQKYNFFGKELSNCSSLMPFLAIFAIAQTIPYRNFQTLTEKCRWPVIRNERQMVISRIICIFAQADAAGYFVP